MRRIVLLIGMVMCLGLNASAQATFGVKAGVNFANVKTSGSGMSITPDSRAGVAIGAFARFNVNETFVIQPELLYSGKGAKIDITEDGASYKSTTKLNYLSIPVIAKLYVNSGFNLQAGPQFDFLLSAKEDYEVSYAGEFESGEDDIKDDIKSLDFGLAFGLGYDFPNGFGLDARYMLGVSELANSPEDGVKTNSKGFQFTASYAF